MQKKFLTVFSVFIFGFVAFARAEAPVKDVEDGLNDPYPTDPNFDDYDFDAEDSSDLPKFNTKYFQEKIAREFESADKAFPVLFEFLKKKTKELPEISTQAVDASNLDIEVFKRPKDFPEFLVLRSGGQALMVAVVSTARGGKATPSGRFRGFHYRNKTHRSSKYHQSPMPYAQFFNGNIAFHGIDEKYYPNLGGPASAGCVRIQVADAKKLWDFVNRYGRDAFETQVHPSGTDTFKNADDYEVLVRAVNKSLQERDAAYAVFAKSGIRSPEWPSGYFK
jgi:hypothetical protein